VGTDNFTSHTVKPVIHNTVQRIRSCFIEPYVGYSEDVTRLGSDVTNSRCQFSTLTYLLTPWSRALLEKLTGSAASQEIPRIFGTRRFITVLTSARHLSLSWAKSIQSPQPPPTSWRSILILSSHLRLSALWHKVKKSKVSTVHEIKAYGTSRGIATLILNLGT
jgi:hypothetical protein